MILTVFLGAMLLLRGSSSISINNKTFPEGFLFGVSTSAYQIEGAWNESGKGQSIWDLITHKEPMMIIDSSNADVACDSYHKMDEDIAQLKELGVNFYRFSIAWTRIVPDGNVSNGVNLKGVMYYKEMLRKLKLANIEAMVTLFHFDTPKTLHKLGLFLNERYNYLFVDYARLAFLLFGDEVKYWSTFNEPRGVCTLLLEPFSIDPGRDSYKCTHNIIKCHAMVYRMYEKEFKDEYKGQLSIVLNTNWDEPASNLKEDIEAAERKLLFEFGWYAHPLVFGDYPKVMKTRIRSMTFALSPSRLPKFTKEEKKMIKGTLDFVGVNHYTTSYVTDSPNHDLFRTFDKDVGAVMTYDPEWKNTTLDWLKVVPFGMRKILKWVHDTYKTPIVITENGYVDGGSIVDDERIEYFRDYFSYILDAIYIDNVNIWGYATWSLMDNWEWTNGYTQKFGLYYVNFSSPNRDRIPKKSIQYFKKVLGTKCLIDKCV